MRMQPAEPLPFPVDFRVHEMLAHDVYDVPFVPDREDQVICSYCGETAMGLKDVQHQSWCVYLSGRPEVPN